MSRSGGFEPEIELLGDDAAPAPGSTTSERDRNWWPVWVGLGVIAAIALVGVVSAGSDEPDDAAPVSVPGTDELDEAGEVAGPTTAAPPTTAPSTNTAFDRDDEGSSESATTEAVPGDQTAIDAEEAEAIAAQSAEVRDLGLTGRVVAWYGNELWILDLVSGEWTLLPERVGRGDPWSRSVAPTATGFAIVAHETARSFSHEGELIDEAQGFFYGPDSVVLGEGSVLLASGLYDDSVIELWTLAADGSWASSGSIDSGPVPGGGLSFTAAGGRVFLSPFSGGIFEITKSGSVRVADGVAIASSSTHVMRMYCPERLEDCGLDRVRLEGWSSEGRVAMPDRPDLLYDRAGWSPNLRYWTSSWGPGEVWDAVEGRSVARTTSGNGEVRSAWSADSEWLASWTGAKILLLHVTDGAEYQIDSPVGAARRSNPALLYMP